LKNNVLDWRLRLLQKARIELGNSQKVLDVGCGDGGDCAIFADKCNEVTGIDIDPYSEWADISKANVRLLTADACHLPLPDNHFDIIFAKDTLHHIENHKKAVEEMKRVAKRGGKIFILEANRYNPILYLHMTMLKKHQHFTQPYLTKLMQDSFGDTSFLCVEAHVLPAVATSALGLFNQLEDMLEHIPLVRNYLSYNIALAKKL